MPGSAPRRSAGPSTSAIKPWPTSSARSARRSYGTGSCFTSYVKHAPVLRLRGGALAPLHLGRALLGQRDAGLGGGFPLGLGVDLAAEQDGDADQVQPEDEDRDAGEGAVGLAVVAELGHVEREADRRGHEDQRTDDAAGAYPPPLGGGALRAEVVVGREQQRDRDDRDHPADHR